MTKNTSIPRPSSQARNGGGKRPKRPRSESRKNINSTHNDRFSALRSETADTTTPSRDKTDSDDSYEGRKQNSEKRLYHGVCPDVSNRYRKVGGGRIGQGTYGVVYCARDTWKGQGSRGNSGSDGDGDVDGDGDDQKRKRPTSLSKEGSNEIVALKKCYAHHEASDGFPVTTLREIQALRICSSHPNIVDLLEIAVSSSNSERSTLDNDNGNNKKSTENNDDDSGKKNVKATNVTKSTIKIGKSNVFLVFEHCRYDLAHILDSYQEHRRKSHRHSRSGSSPFSLPQTKTLILQLLSALEFCHSHWLVHRDIKPSNLLYDTTTGRLKVCDFGLSRIASDGHMTPNVVSLWYRAPELLLSFSPSKNGLDSDHRIKYSFPIDLWATGCVVAELLKGRPFLDGSSEIEQLEKMQDALGPPPLDLYSLPRSSNGNGRNSSRRSKSRTMGMWDRFEYLPPEGLTLLARLLDYDPNGRWTASKAWNADFLAPTSNPAPIEDLRSMPRGFPGC